MLFHTSDSIWYHVPPTHKPFDQSSSFFIFYVFIIEYMYIHIIINQLLIAIVYVPLASKGQGRVIPYLS